MKKKVLLSFLAIIILIYPVSTAMFPQQADAFVSKLMGLSAKKMAKEVAKDIAVESAANFALNEAFKIADAQMAKYNQKEAYKIVCLYKLTGEVCDKPIAIKENLTEADKVSIAHQAELELDKLVSPDGKGFSRWQKFMDWFGPVWLTSAIMTVITYAIDSDVRTLFNEAGYNALVALGLIQPVTTKENLTIQEQNEQLPPRTVEQGSTPDNKMETYLNTTTANGINYGGYPPTAIPFQNLIIKTEISGSSTWKDVGLAVNDVSAREYLYNFLPTKLQIGNSRYRNTTNTYEATFAMNGEIKGTVLGNKLTNTTDFIYPQGVSPQIEKTKAILFRTPYQVGGFYYTDVLFDTVDGNIMTVQIKSSMDTNLGVNGQTIQSFRQYATGQESSPKTIRTTFYKDQYPVKNIMPPMYTQEGLDLQKSNYEKDGNVALVPPSAMPYKKISTGEIVNISPNPVQGGEPIYTTPDGTTVPEEDIELVQDPVVTPSPSGAPTVTPTPTPSNPSPEPMPLTPSTPVNPPAPPQIETGTPIYPEGESCSVGLKLPKFNPLLHTISDAFPFSIPFDLKDGFDAIFAEMGNEKPEFDYKFKFMGDEQSWKITIPDYFDSWKAFTDSFLIFIFDVGIIYAIYRFMGGGN